MIDREKLAAIKKRHEHTAACLSMYGRSHVLDGESAVEDRAALLDALEEQEAMTSALNGDVTELGQRLEAAEERERGLRKALEEIARQKLHAEITDRDPDELDWLGGYEVCVKRARSALAETAP